MVAVASQEWPESAPKHRFIAQYHALWGLGDLMRMGTLSERRELMESMLQEDVMGLCIRLLRHQLCVMQQLAVNVLRLLAAESFLGECITPSIAAELMEAVCIYTFIGPDRTVDQVLDPITSWQSQMMVDKADLSPEQRAKYCPRVYAICQESAVWIMHGILCTSSPQPPTFCLEILKKRPQILDDLFDCAILSRPACYPETKIVPVTCETIILLFRWPDYVVPGAPSDKAFKAQSWKAMSQAMAILTSRLDWVEKLVEIWMRAQEEDLQKVRTQWRRVGCDYGAAVQPSDDDFKRVFESRGVTRACLLRLITTLTHAADTCGISNAQVESLLHMAYLGCHKPDESLFSKPFASVESLQEIFSVPPWATLTKTTVASPFSVAPQFMLGPTALVRLYTVLAQRKALDGIQALRKPLPGLSTSTSLRQVQQIAHPDIICRVIKISQLRLRAWLEEGRHRLATRRNNGNDINEACAVFMGSAELAAALVALDTHTEGMYAAELRGARRHLVIALGNASQMAMNLKQYQRALHLASSAVSAAESIPAEEGLDPGVVVKNKRRIDQANAGLQRRP
ncbi:hypothetical protein CONPUDRAFT_162101 [Coniophora puteana RWD-64-598 SS2]|uniref:Uncharacterized protein n=1 Tax=Coniophora puteana (strain RWD-64-598) TaxID=741705 RepID=A0A5M3N053_CONPW|nr:uncharacterized protein CONPUDRAFT_162101 [Coniophora puteana RWD-64-598 SS2]EIW84752.1 hypothetical protein CONPUDRAFT_162101 [Coniophora puteana RWD-64-598 SS2]